MESTVDVGFPCLNCKKKVKPDEAKVFQGVFVCASCHEIAARAFTRLDKELMQLRTLAGEAIRIALVRGELHLGPATSKDIPKSELVRRVIELAEEKKAKES